MDNLLGTAGNIAGILGILVCAVAGIFRLSGSFYVFGYEAQTLFIAGTALMVMACLAKLHQIAK